MTANRVIAYGVMEGSAKKFKFVCARASNYTMS